MAWLMALLVVIVVFVFVVKILGILIRWIGKGID